MDVSYLIWMFVIGASIAMIVMYYNVRFLGKFVRKLIQIDATSPESAMTFEELGLKMSPAVKYSLRPGTSFSETVLCTQDGRYYIAPDKVSMAKSKYKGKDTTIVFILLCILALIVVAFAFSKIFPDLLTKVGNEFSQMFDGGQRI